MKKNRIFTTLLILLILSMSVVVFATGKDTTDLDRATMVANNATGEITNVKISLNGVQLNIPSEYGYPFIDNQSRTIIPLRIISERLGHQVEWDNSTQTATIDGEISITIGEKIVRTPNGDIKMDTFAILKGDRTYVPLRFVVEALGYEVSYNGPNRANNYQHMVDISGQPKTPTQPIGKEPIKNGNVYTIFGEYGSVELDIENDRRVQGNKKFGIANEKAYELSELIHKSIKMTETANNVKFEFIKPELPEGLRYGANIVLETYSGSFITVYSSGNEETRFSTVRSDGYREVNYNETPISEIKNITFTSEVYYGNDGSQYYKADLRTGKVARGMYEFLYD